MISIDIKKESLLIETIYCDLEQTIAYHTMWKPFKTLDNIQYRPYTLRKVKKGTNKEVTDLFCIIIEYSNVEKVLNGFCFLAFISIFSSTFSIHSHLRRAYLIILSIYLSGYSLYDYLLKGSFVCEYCSFC